MTQQSLVSSEDRGRRRRVLVIPHASAAGARIRGRELADRLARFHEVFCLTWSPDKYGAARLRDRLRAEVGDALRPISVEGENGVRLLRCPTLYHGGAAAARFNSWQLRRLVRRYRIDVVINGSLLFSPRSRLPVPYVFDLVDDHAAGCRAGGRSRVEAWLEREMGVADAVTTVSHQLAREVAARFGRETIYLPNGADFSAPEPSAVEEARALRSALGLEGSFAIGCIGHHGEWSGLAFLVEVFRRLHQADPGVRLLVVGGGSEVERVRAGAAPRGVSLVGPVSPRRIGPYFLALDLGVLPFAESPFTHHSLPLKVLEYSAARKLVVSTPLAELEGLRLPNVILARREVGAWLEAIALARGRGWEESWREHFRPFDWTRIAAQLAALIEGLACRGEIGSKADARVLSQL